MEIIRVKDAAQGGKKALIDSRRYGKWRQGLGLATGSTPETLMQK